MFRILFLVFITIAFIYFSFFILSFLFNHFVFNKTNKDLLNNNEYYDFLDFIERLSSNKEYKKYKKSIDFTIDKSLEPENLIFIKNIFNSLNDLKEKLLLIKSNDRFVKRLDVVEILNKVVFLEDEAKQQLMKMLINNYDNYMFVTYFDKVKNKIDGYNKDLEDIIYLENKSNLDESIAFLEEIK